MGEGALEGLHQNKEAFQKAGVYDKMERDAQQLANGQSERGKATLGAKAGLKQLKQLLKSRTKSLGWLHKTS